MTDLRERLHELLAGCIAEHAAEFDKTIELAPGDALLGGHESLDSLGLVTVLALFEAEISDELGVDVLFADERAMSQERGPFRTPAALVEFAVMLVREQQEGCT